MEEVEVFCELLDLEDDETEVEGVVVNWLKQLMLQLVKINIFSSF